MNATGAPPPDDRAAAPALLIAPAAQAWLRSARPARVLNVFDRAAYLIDDRGEILLLAEAPVGMGPFTLKIGGSDHPLSTWLNVDDPVRVRRGYLGAGGISVRLDSAVHWDPSPDWEAVRATAAGWSAHLHVIRELIQRSGPRGIFAILVDGGPPSDAATIEDRLIRSARQSAQELLQAVVLDDDARLAQAASQLAGLGRGLTPSGDDFLMGTIFALWATVPAARPRRQGRRLSQAAAKRTTTISAAWLKAAARGEASEPWHRLFASLAAERHEGVHQATRAILRTGHTSGEDALIGFVCAVAGLRDSPARGAGA